MRGYINLLKPLRRLSPHQQLGVNFYSKGGGKLLPMRKIVILLEF